MRSVIVSAVLALVASWSPEVSALGTGTQADPFLVDDYPFAHEWNTVWGEDLIDDYSCASWLDEGGPEVIYHGTVTEGRVTAWVEGDIDGVVDVDVHIIQDMTVISRSGTCLDRGHTWAEADVATGDLWIAVDTYVSGGSPLPGAYVLRVDHIGLDTDRRRPVGEGVSWVQHLYGDLYGGTQTVNILEIDLTHPSVLVEPIQAGDCTTTGDMGEAGGALAGVNAGFFSWPGCVPVGLSKVDGVVHSYNASDRAALGMSPGGASMRIAGTTDGFDEALHAMGGLPTLMDDGLVDVSWEAEGAGASFTSDRHPRTLACLTSTGVLYLVTFDGRTDGGLGVSLFDAADYLDGTLGCWDAMNLDGGGSTTMWISGMPAGGVVSYPSDNDEPDHLGSREVSNGLFVWSEPWNHPPRFVTEPTLAAHESVEWTYRAEAIDIDLDPVDYLLSMAPADMSLVADTLTWTPDWSDEGPHDVILTATDGDETAFQTFTITVTVDDADGDGLPDGWEDEVGLDPTRDDSEEDPDGDGYTNAEEFEMGTDPLDGDDPPVAEPDEEEPAPDLPDAPDSAEPPPDAPPDGSTDAAPDVGDDPGAGVSDGSCGCTLVR